MESQRPLSYPANTRLSADNRKLYARHILVPLFYQYQIYYVLSMSGAVSGIIIYLVIKSSPNSYDTTFYSITVCIFIAYCPCSCIIKLGSNLPNGHTKFGFCRLKTEINSDITPYQHHTDAIVPTATTWRWRRLIHAWCINTWNI